MPVCKQSVLRTGRPRLLAPGAAMAIALLISSLPAHASDSTFDCASPGGVYTLAPGGSGLELFEGEVKLDYRLVRETTIRKREGLCAASDGKAFAWHAHSFLYEVETRSLGEAITILFLCEEGGSGIPAMITDCKESTTRDLRLVPAYKDMAPAAK